MLSALIGGIIMVLANDLLVLFLGLETLSLAFYLLVASSRKRTTSGEAGLKYFILGGFASAFFLYGIALIFGVAGSTNLPKIAAGLAQLNVGSSDSIILVGIALLLVGFAFKVSLVPFHVWTPDVYQGAPTPITALMTSVGKVAAFSAFVRVFLSGLAGRADDWAPAVYVLAIVTLVVGSLVAVVQTDVKRMLAFSSISHAGFILVGLEAATHTSNPDSSLGLLSITSYLFIYSFLVIGTFAVVSAVAGERESTVDSFKGLGKSNPVLALAMTALLLGQAGIPVTSGFIAKFGVIRAAVTVGSYPLAIISMVTAVISAYVYLKVIVSLFFESSESSTTLILRSNLAVVIMICLVATLVIGLLPNMLNYFLIGL